MLWKGFQRPKRLEFERETLTDRFGRFYAQPFERGFGTTIGNALRRVLLSSIEGAAITAVKIDGVLHEFSPIPGVVEDATDIILNLKQIPITCHVDHTKTLTLRKDKAGPVRASDIEADADIEILRHHTTRFMSRVPRNEEVAMALGEFGGHLRSNGPPGWAILGRALERLLLIEIGWKQHAEAIDD